MPRSARQLLQRLQVGLASLPSSWEATERLASDADELWDACDAQEIKASEREAVLRWAPCSSCKPLRAAGRQHTARHLVLCLHDQRRAF